MFHLRGGTKWFTVMATRLRVAVYGGGDGERVRTGRKTGMAFWGWGDDMFKKMYRVLLLVTILLNIVGYAIAEDNSHVYHLINLRYSEALSFNTNYTMQSTMSPLQLTAGLGIGGYKAGIGIGFGGNFDNNYSGEFKTGGIGAGIKLSYLQSWHFDTNKKYHGKWIGLEATLAFIFGIDIGYYKSVIAGKKESLTTINVGLFY